MDWLNKLDINISNKVIAYNLCTVKNRDETEDLCQIFVKEPNGNYYVFMWPTRPFKEDNGRSVNPTYVFKLQGKTEVAYCKIARPFVNLFPSWIKY